MATQPRTRKRSAAPGAQIAPAAKWPDASAIGELDPRTRSDVAQEFVYQLLQFKLGDGERRFEEFISEDSLLRDLAARLQVPYMVLRLQADEFIGNPEVSEQDIVEWITWCRQHDPAGLPEALRACGGDQRKEG